MSARSVRRRPALQQVQLCGLPPVGDDLIGIRRKAAHVPPPPNSNQVLGSEVVTAPLFSNGRKEAQITELSQIAAGDHLRNAGFLPIARAADFESIGAIQEG